VERGRPVLLRGPLVDEPEQEALVLRRARWIRERLAQVNQPLASEPIVTGSRLRYAGRTYFTEVRHVPDILKPRLIFTASRFIVDNPDGVSIPPDVLMPLLERFYRESLAARNRPASDWRSYPSLPKPLG
jgi:predicted metal-dependent hydrolase